jgi:hypothetical protein
MLGLRKSCKKGLNVFFLFGVVQRRLNSPAITGGTIMIKKTLIAERARKITGSFAFIEHRFLQKGFLADLNHHELGLYIFLVLASDRHGLSYYAYDKICTLLSLTLDEYIVARDALIEKDLLAFDGYLFQVLSLPEAPPAPQKPISSKAEMERQDPATIRRIVREQFGR